MHSVFVHACQHIKIAREQVLRRPIEEEIRSIFYLMTWKRNRYFVSILNILHDLQSFVTDKVRVYQNYSCSNLVACISRGNRMNGLFLTRKRKGFCSFISKLLHDLQSYVHACRDTSELHMSNFWKDFCIDRKLNQYFILRLERDVFFPFYW